MPIFMSTPASNTPVELPFKFQGGLALTTKTIGFMLAAQGIYSMIAQLVLFPFVVRCFGTLNTYRFVLCIWPLLYLSVPYLVLLPPSFHLPAAYIALICKITLHVIAFPSNAMLLANSAPSLTVLGSINGVAASTASLSRSLGPTITGYLHSKGLELNYSVLSWWACGVVCSIGALESFWVEKDDAAQPEDQEKTEKMESDDCEAGSRTTNSQHIYSSRDDSVEELGLFSQPSREYCDAHGSTSSVSLIRADSGEELADISFKPKPADNYTHLR